MLGLAALFSLFAALGGGVLDVVSSKSKDKGMQYASTIGTTIFVFLAGLLFNWWLLYEGTPVFNGINWMIPVTLNLVIVLISFGIANGVTERLSLAPVVSVLGLLGLLVTLIVNYMPLGDASNVYGHELNVPALSSLPKQFNSQDYPPTSDNHMVTVSDQNALFKANQAMGQIIPNTSDQVGTKFNLGTCVLQSVNGHMYYICDLKVSGNHNPQVVPGYIVVDAEDPNAAPQARFTYTDQTTGKPVNLALNYTPGAPGSHSMTRLLYNWNRSVYFGDLTPEVDDNWRLYYTASLDTPAVRMQQSVPTAFITVDPQTGEIKRYALNQIPSWVDRVYSADMAKMMLNWWGQWGVVPWSTQGSGGRYQVDGDVTLVYTDKGPAWQALMTSLNSDTSVSYVALMDTRSNNVRLYPAPVGLTVQSTATHAIETAGVNKRGLQPVNLALHEIYGELVWVAPLVASGTAGTGPESSQGLAFLNATDPNGSSVIIGTDKADALSQLSAQIANGDNNNSPTATANKKTITGTVSVVDKYDTGGQTYLVFMIKGDTNHLYRAQVVGDTAGNLEMALAKVGDTVTLTYLDNTSGAPSQSGPSIVNVSSFTDASLATANH